MVLANEIEVVVCWESFGETSVFLARKVTDVGDVDSSSSFLRLAIPSSYLDCGRDAWKYDSHFVTMR